VLRALEDQRGVELFESSCVTWIAQAELLKVFNDIRPILLYPERVHLGLKRLPDLIDGWCWRSGRGESDERRDCFTAGWLDLSGAQVEIGRRGRLALLLQRLAR
jgi:hypothetical protein